MALTYLLVLVNCVTLFTVNEPRVGLPLPAATDVLLKRHRLVRTNFDVGGMLDLSALESSLNLLLLCFAFLSNAHFSTAWLSSSTVVAQ
jgi:hypothetical protein